MVPLRRYAPPRIHLPLHKAGQAVQSCGRTEKLQLQLHTVPLLLNAAEMSPPPAFFLPPQNVTGALAACLTAEQTVCVCMSAGVRVGGWVGGRLGGV